LGHPDFRHDAEAAIKMYRDYLQWRAATFPIDPATIAEDLSSKKFQLLDGAQRVAGSRRRRSGCDLVPGHRRKSERWKLRRRLRRSEARVLSIASVQDRVHDPLRDRGRTRSRSPASHHHNHSVRAFLAHDIFPA
jgi:hypothetical protein